MYENFFHALNQLDFSTASKIKNSLLTDLLNERDKEEHEVDAGVWEGCEFYHEARGRSFLYRSLIGGLENASVKDGQLITVKQNMARVRRERQYRAEAESPDNDSAEVSRDDAIINEHNTCNDARALEQDDTLRYYCSSQWLYIMNAEGTEANVYECPDHRLDQRYFLRREVIPDLSLNRQNSDSKAESSDSEAGDADHDLNMLDDAQGILPGYNASYSPITQRLYISIPVTGEIAEYHCPDHVLHKRQFVELHNVDDQSDSDHEVGLDPEIAAERSLPEDARDIEQDDTIKYDPGSELLFLIDSEGTEATVYKCPRHMVDNRYYIKQQPIMAEDDEEAKKREAELLHELAKLDARDINESDNIRYSRKNCILFVRVDDKDIYALYRVPHHDMNRRFYLTTQSYDQLRRSPHWESFNKEDQT